MNTDCSKRVTKDKRQDRQRRGERLGFERGRGDKQGNALGVLALHLGQNIDVEVLEQRLLRHASSGITRVVPRVEHQRYGSGLAAKDSRNGRCCSHNGRMAAQVAVYVLRAGCCCRAAAQRQDLGTRAQELFADSETYARGTTENNLQRMRERKACAAQQNHIKMRGAWARKIGEEDRRQMLEPRQTHCVGDLVAVVTRSRAHAAVQPTAQAPERHRGGKKPPISRIGLELRRTPCAGRAHRKILVIASCKRR